MTPTTPRLPYDDADGAEAMRLDAEAAGRRLGVGREARLDRCGRSASAGRARVRPVVSVSGTSGVRS